MACCLARFLNGFLLALHLFHLLVDPFGVFLGVFKIGFCCPSQFPKKTED